MSIQLVNITNTLTKVGEDAKRLIVFSQRLDEVASCSKGHAPFLIREFIYAQDLCNELLSKAVRADGRAKAALDTAKSIAYLDKAADYLKSRNIKDTSEARKQYVDLDDDVQAAADVKAQTEAMVMFLKGKTSIFRQAHDDVKKITYADDGRNPYDPV